MPSQSSDLSLNEQSADTTNAQQPANSAASIDKYNNNQEYTELSNEQFGHFIANELNTLDADLLREAMGRIYDVICTMQMKQVMINNEKSV